MTRLKALIILALVILFVYGLALYKANNLIEDIKVRMPAQAQGQQKLQSLIERR